MAHQVSGKLKKPGFQAVLIAALAILVGLGTYLYLLSYQSRINGEQRLVSVYVANSEIATGTSFDEIKSRKLFRTASFPIKSLPQDALTRLDQISGNLKTKGPLASGQILIATYFDAQYRGDVSLTIPQGMLAITASIDDVSRVGNFVLPGSRVVVFATGSVGSGNATRVLIPSALVLAIGKQTGLSYSAQTISASPLVTLALTPRDAQKLVLAEQSLKITLALAYNNDPGALLSTGNQTTQTELFTS